MLQQITKGGINYYYYMLQQIYLYYLRVLQQITKGGLIIISITCCNRSTISSTVLFENVATNGGYALFENVATDNEGGIIITSCHSCNR